MPPIQITTNEDTPITVPIGIDSFWKVDYIDRLEFPEGVIRVTGSDDKITFTPTPNYFGTTELMINLSELYLPKTDPLWDVLTKLQITVNPVNDPPVWIYNYHNDQVLSSINIGVFENTPYEITYKVSCGFWLKNSNCSNPAVTDSGVVWVSDLDGDKLTFTIVQPPTKGKITQNTKTTYTSNAGFTGQDSMIIKLSDGKLESENLTVNIFVEPKPSVTNTSNPKHSVDNTSNQTNSKNNLIKTCGVGTYLVNGVCKIRPDQIKTSTITLTSAEPKIVDSNNRPVSIIKANDNLFVNVGVENLGKQTEKFVGAYRYIPASTGKWSEWTWVSASVNVGKYTNISIPWKPSMKDSYAFDIQIWDNEQQKNKISSEKLTVNVIPADLKKVDDVKKVDGKKALADKKTAEAKKIADAKRAEKIKIAKEKAKERALKKANK
jgi:hypothetical protein